MIFAVLEISLAIVGASTVVRGYREYKKDPEEFFGVRE